MARLLLVVAAALTLAGAAAAGTIQDLAGLGYTVSISNPGPSGQNCPTYYISGHGIGVYANCQTPQSDVDSWANPAAICNADWQINHPDQLAAVNRIRGEGWSITGDQCADVYTVSNSSGGAVAYSGPGAGLVGYDPGIPAVSQTPSAPGTSAPDPNAGQCLPLCSGTTTTTTVTGGTTSTSTSGTTSTTTDPTLSADSSPRWTSVRVAA